MSGAARATILEGDVLDRLRDLPAGSVQTVVTSPPYWGLRDYGADGQIGLEATPEEHTARIVAVFDEVARVLRVDGTAWVNYGDGYRDKQLQGLPWRVAFALQGAGWYLRSEIIWAKPNPMPESCTDRPTKSHEKLFLLAHPESGGRYFYDADAVREAGQWDSSGCRGYRGGNIDNAHRPAVVHGEERTGRNLRDVWTIATQPFPEAHFATFPEKLVEPCIKAGTSQRGACPECGAPWARVVEVRNAGGSYHDHENDLGRGQRHEKGKKLVGADFYAEYAAPRTTGWAPTCDHGDGLEVEPCVVLDPFAGSGTTLLVALRLGCRAIGIEINHEYAEIARRRIRVEAEQVRIF